MIAIPQKVMMIIVEKKLQNTKIPKLSIILKDKDKDLNKNELNESEKKIIV